MLQSEPPDPPPTGETMNNNERELNERIDQLSARFDILTRRLHDLEDENAELLRLLKAVAELQDLLKKEGHWFVNDLSVKEARY